MKPSILVVTELYPNVTNSFLGIFVARQLRFLLEYFTIAVLTTHSIGLSNRFRYVQPGFREDAGIHVYSVPYLPLWLNLLGSAKIISHDKRLWINKRITGYRLCEMAERLHRQYNFKLVYGQEMYVGDEAVPIGTRLGIPKIFTLHGTFDYHRKLFGSQSVTAGLQNMERADRLIAVSRVAADSYRRNGLSRSDISVIPNGVYPPPAPGPETPFHDFVRNRTVLLSVGFFSREKRMGQAIQLLCDLHASGLENTVLVIVGKGELEGELKAAAKHLGVARYVLFAGEVAPADMPAVYAEADILVHPSVVESFSMVCLEAMSHGKPVVCTSGIGLLEFVRAGIDTVVVPPDSPELLFSAVARLVKDPEQRRRIGEEARRTAMSMSWEIQVEKVRSVMDSVRGV